MLVNVVAPLPHVTIYGHSGSSKADFLRYRMVHRRMADYT